MSALKFILALALLAIDVAPWFISSGQRRGKSGSGGIDGSFGDGSFHANDHGGHSDHGGGDGGHGGGDGGGSH